MLKVEATTNREEIESVIFDKDVRPYLVTDMDIVKGDLNLFNENYVFYSLKKDDVLYGIGLFYKGEDRIAVADVGILPEYRGSDAYKLAKIALHKFIDDYEYEYVVARIEKENKRSLYFSLRIGFGKVCEDDNYYYLRYKYGRSS